MEYLRKVLSNQRDIGTKYLLDKNLIRKIKKRVVSTLFLFLLLIIFSCDFKSPEEWETPGWYMDLTLPLLNTEYSFEEFLNDSTMFYSDTLLDEVSDVIHVSYPVPIDSTGIHDSIFHINSLPVEIDDFGISEPIDLQVDTTIFASFTGGLDFSEYEGCFPDIFLSDVEIETLEGEIESFYMDILDNTLFEIKSVTLSSGELITTVGNDLPFPVSFDFTLMNVEDTLYTSNNSLNNIAPNSGASSSYSFIDKKIELDSPLSWKLTAGVPENAESGEPCIAGLDGWPIQGDPGMDFELEFEFGGIDTVEIIFKGIESETLTKSLDIPGYNDIAIKKIIIGDSMPLENVLDSNIIILDIVNNIPVSASLQFELLNLFETDDADSDHLITEILIAPDSPIDTTIDFNGYILVKDAPSDNIEQLGNIESLEMIVVVSMNDTTYKIAAEDNKINLGLEFNQVEIRNMNLDYISAITHNIEFPVTESPPIGIPAGFTDVEFMDFIMEIELFNQIGIPLDIDLEIQGIKGDKVGVTVPLETAIGVPIGSNYGCDFEFTGDTVRTVIKTNRLYQTTEYFCNTTDPEPSESLDTLFFYESTNTSGFVELLNYVPERINISGFTAINGLGILSKGSEIWGTFTLESPLSFIFKKPMTVIPADHTSLSPIDSAKSEDINSALIEAKFYVNIINRSPGSGNLSILISDNTLFPLFLDSLGTWDVDTINDTLGIDMDSISFIPNPLADNLALEVFFFRNDTLQFFIGRMLNLELPAPDSINYEYGYVIPAFSGTYTDSILIDNKIMDWIITDQPRNTNVMITFDGSRPLNDSTFIPLTLQTINAIEVRACITLQLDTGSLISE